MTLKICAAFLMGLVISAMMGAWLVPFLRKKNAGQQIREDGPTWHNSKNGTPTMGGIMFITAAVLACFSAGWSVMRNGDFSHIFVLVFAIIYGAIGFLDDYQKVINHRNLGLKAKEKFALQLLAAALFIVVLIVTGKINRSESGGVLVYLPFFNINFSLPAVIYIIFAAFVIVGTVNAVNITDGVDGLATGTSLPVFIFYTVLGFMWGERYLGLTVFAAAMTGGLLGFLFYNFNPAKIFMGDTGSLFLGGAIVALAFAYDMPLILITLGIVFIVETLSDIIQVTIFKYTKRKYGEGKRFFKMAPFHHHLEKGGWTGKVWKEKELFALFTAVSAFFAIISFLGVQNRF